MLSWVTERDHSRQVVLKHTSQVAGIYSSIIPNGEGDNTYYTLMIEDNTPVPSLVKQKLIVEIIVSLLAQQEDLNWDQLS